MSQPNGHEGLTLTVLGCGTLGTAILSGIFASIAHTSKNGNSSTNDDAVPKSSDEVPPRLPSRFIACVRRPVSAERVKKTLAQHAIPIEVALDDNVRAVQEASVVILGCKPQMWREVLGKPGDPIQEALRGKLLISILAGVPAIEITEHLYPGVKPSADACKVVRVMPNTAASVGNSMTVIANPDFSIGREDAAMVTWIFNRIGRVVRLPANTLDASTALCGSGPAFMALVLEALADGGVAMGLPRVEAQIMAAQTMKGAAEMVLNGEHPAMLRDKVSTPGGCTIGGLLVLEEGRVRGAVARAVREATVVASQLGKGVQGVNGTRF